MTHEQALDLAYPLLKDLTEKKYEKLQKNQALGRLTEEEIERTLKEYGGALTLPKKDSLKDIWIYPIQEN